MCQNIRCDVFFAFTKFTGKDLNRAKADNGKLKGTQHTEALFRSEPVNPVNAKRNITLNISTHICSTK